MKTSQSGIDLIKKFEGFRENAYLIAGEKFYTIGYGHSGADVGKDQRISREQAEAILKKDLTKFEASVENAKKTSKLTFMPNQNQFDALVSFTYNCGAGNLYKLVDGRSAQTVADKMLLYCNGANPNVKAGLLERRKKERNLFLGNENQTKAAPEVKCSGQTVMKVCAAKGLNLRDKPGTDGKCVISLMKGTSVTVLDRSSAKWYKVSVAGNMGQQITGYCCAKYLN